MADILKRAGTGIISSNGAECPFRRSAWERVQRVSRARRLFKNQIVLLGASKPKLLPVPFDAPHRWGG